MDRSKNGSKLNLVLTKTEGGIVNDTKQQLDLLGNHKLQRIRRMSGQEASRSGLLGDCQ
jgi:hypothetical protein